MVGHTPNTAVKPTSADGTEVETPWESRRSQDTLLLTSADRWAEMPWGVGYLPILILLSSDRD